MADGPTPSPDPPETVEYVTQPVSPRPASPEPDGSDAPAAANAPGTPGQSFGDYELIDEIARGGQGIVYLAREKRSGRLVALKKMLGPRGTSPTDLSRFMFEAQSAGELNHPGIVTVHAWGLHEGHPFYTMDFVPGQPLHRVLAQGQLAIDRAVRYLLSIADALACAHARGIVHRDLKPSNIIIDEADQPRVLDFGLAKRQRAQLPELADDSEILEALPASSPGSPVFPLVSPARGATPITEKGAILGTPSYMAPEQVRRERGDISPASDVHALGAIAYEMLAGRPPFAGDSTYHTLMDVLNRQPVPLEKLRPDIPPDLAQAVHRCLDKDPRRRYPDAAALADELQARWRQASASRRFSRLAGLAAAALFLLALVPLLVDLALFVLQRLFPNTLPPGLGVLEAVTTRLVPNVLALTGAARLLDSSLLALTIVGGPMLAGAGLLAWTAAWVWHSARPGWVAALAVVVALAALVLWTVLSLGDLYPSSAILLPWLLLANAASAVALLLARGAGRNRPGEAANPADPGGSYLQKLFTVRGTSRPRKSGVAGPPAALADFEPGKLQHSWDTGDVHWARQLSLDRPVFLWRDNAPAPPGTPPGATRPGVVVDHPAVLRLHALGASPQGHLLVTEAPAATPLRELLGQRSLTPEEAIGLTTRLARALQAFHEQGVVHGRLSPDWILVRGDLEPLLCPCGVPNRDPAARQADLAALAAMLASWLPRRPFTWRLETLAPVYRVADLAARGDYARPLDFALDLEQALRVGRVQWRERLASGLALAALLVPWAALAARAAAADDDPAPALSPATLTALVACPAAALLGFAQTRLLVAVRRLRGEGRDRLLRSRPAGRALRGVVFVALAAPLGWLAFRNQAPCTPGLVAAWLGLLAGYAAVGTALGAAVTFAEFLVKSFRGFRPSAGTPHPDPDEPPGAASLA